MSSPDSKNVSTRLVQDFPDFAGLGIRHSQPGLLVVPRRRHEGELGAIRRPLDVGKGAAAVDVVTDGGSVLVRGHVEAHHPGSLRAIHVDDHPVDAENHRVLGQGVFPRLQLRVAHLRGDQIHHSHAPPVVLEGGDLFRVGGPEEHGAVALGPPGVVGGVPEVLDAVGGELGLSSRRYLPDPEIVVPDEGGLGPIG